MTLYPEAVLFPHVRLAANEAAAFNLFFNKITMLAPEGAAAALPDYVTAVVPNAALTDEILKAYANLQKIGANALAENIDYHTGQVSAAPPLYDKEAPLGILSEFREAGQPGPSKTDQAYIAAALTLMLSEDAAALDKEARKSLENANAATSEMWLKLKGGADPLQTAGDLYAGSLPDDGLVKKRLTAWSILARMQAFETGFLVTFDENLFNYCIQMFEPVGAVKQSVAGNLELVSYELQLNVCEFLDALAGPETGCSTLNHNIMTLGYVNLEPVE